MGLFFKKNKNKDTEKKNPNSFFSKILNVFKKSSSKKTDITHLKPVEPTFPMVYLETLVSNNNDSTSEPKNMSEYNTYCSEQEPYTLEDEKAVEHNKVFSEFFADLKETKTFDFEGKIAKLKSHKECSNKEAFDIFYSFAREFITYFSKYGNKYRVQENKFLVFEVLELIDNSLKELKVDHGILADKNRLQLDLPNLSYILFNQTLWAFNLYQQGYIERVADDSIVTPHFILNKIRFFVDNEVKTDLFQHIILGGNLLFSEKESKNKLEYIQHYYNYSESLKPLYQISKNVNFDKSEFSEMLPLLLVSNVLKKTTFLPLNYYEVINEVFVERLLAKNPNLKAKDLCDKLAEIRRGIIIESDFGVYCYLSAYLFGLMHKLGIEEFENEQIDSKTLSKLRIELENQVCMLFAYLMVLRRKVKDPTISLFVRDLNLIREECLWFDVNVDFKILYLGLKKLGI